jgi:transglutaminase-like putative cysteine protease
MRAPSSPPFGTRWPNTTSRSESFDTAMTSPTRWAPGRADVADLRDRFQVPRAGWQGFALLTVMVLALSWSVQGAAWLERMEFLVPLGLWAVLTGTLVGMLRWSIVATLPLGAIIGAGFLVWMIGGEYHAALGNLERLFVLREELVRWTATVIETGYPAEMSPYAFGLGALMWGTAFISAYVVYRYNRVLDAILLLGAAMIANMSATFTNLFGHLVLFVIAALLLWLHAALTARQDGWQRRRVNENVEVTAAIMRTGIVFAAASVALAWVLTTVAVAAPLTGAWRSLDGVWTDMRDQFEGVFGSLTNPQSRITGSTFGPAFTVSGEWVSNDAEVLLLAAPRPLYLRTSTYDEYTGRGWVRTDGPRRNVEAGDPLFSGATTEWPLIEEALVLQQIGIEMRQTVGRNMFTAGSPLRFFVPAVVTEPGGYPLLGSTEAPQPIAPGEAYELITALSRATEADLAAAGTEYPDEIRALYLDDGGVTDRVAQLAQEVVTAAEAQTPFDQAKALAAFLRSDAFTYSTVGPTVADGADLVDTFLFEEGEKYRTGYCQYFASSMALMARSLGLPARVAVGFAPGEPAGEGTYLVREANAHAWVEIYFPGYGWEIFESTRSIPGVVRVSGDPDSATSYQQIDPSRWLEEDIPVPDALDGVDALPSAELAPGAIDPQDPQAADEAAANRTNNALIVAAIVLVGLVALWWRMQHLNRRWRLLPPGERAWQQLTAAAGRAGIGPRPSETIYEYAGWLEEQLPKHSEPIRQVADGKVWQAYSGRTMSAFAAHTLDKASATLRIPLIGLAMRRWLHRLTRREG